MTFCLNLAADAIREVAFSVAVIQSLPIRFHAEKVGTAAAPRYYLGRVHRFVERTRHMPTLEGGKPALLCHRRDLLRVGGGVAVAGLTLPSVLLRQSALAGERVPSRKARTCILVYLLGGPPHLDTFDLKPDAPAEIRGEFNPIATSVPGLQICELLPKLASLASEYALIRSVTQRNSNHTPIIYYTLTGRHTARPDQDN